MRHVAYDIRYVNFGGAVSERWQTIAPSGNRKHQPEFWKIGQEELGAEKPLNFIAEPFQHHLLILQ